MFGLGSQAIRLVRVGGTYSTCCFRNLRTRVSYCSSLTAQEAGRRAEAVASSRTPSSSSSSSMSTQLAHAGMVSSVANTPMAPPLHLSSTYTRSADGLYQESDSIYSRMDNPTRRLLEETVFRVETHGLVENRSDKTNADTDDGTSYAFSSGMMAVSSILLAHESPISILLPHDVYHGVPTVAMDVFQRHNVQLEYVDMSKPSLVTETLSRLDPAMDAIVWIETPSNPLCHVIDIEAICQAARMTTSKQTVTVVVDSTLSPPIITQPLLVRILLESLSVCVGVKLRWLVSCGPKNNH